MLEFNGFKLDDHHFIGIFMDKNGTRTWQMLTFKCVIPEPSEDGTYNFQSRSEDGILFTIEQIDPHCFEFNGHKYRFEIEEGAFNK